MFIGEKCGLPITNLAKKVLIIFQIEKFTHLHCKKHNENNILKNDVLKNYFPQRHRPMSFHSLFVVFTRVFYSKCNGNFKKSLSQKKHKNFA